jgi:hypothetical protein
MPLDPDQCAAPATWGEQDLASTRPGINKTWDQQDLGTRPGINKKAMISRLLRRDIIVVLSIKLSIVLISAFFVFGPRQRPRIDINALQDLILNNSDR